jgi:rare lipoprotein A
VYHAGKMPPVAAVRSCLRSTLNLSRTAVAMLALAGLTACASHRGGGSGVASHGTYKIGAPYTIDGVAYVPQEEFNHVETGVASWYGPGFHGHATANGEQYDQQERTAAHRTLQMPSIVRVTNLDNGRTTVVRVNDRGPYARSRIIDLSRAAADDLDIVRHGTAHVRIDQLPAESETVKEVALGGGGPAEQQAALAQLAAGRRSASPPTAPAPTAELSPAPAPQDAFARGEPSAGTGGGGPSIASIASAASQSSGSFYVQTGAFSNMTNAERQRGLISSYGTTEVSQANAGGREVYRVRLGPYTTSDAAGIVADRLKRSGYGEARVVAN